MSFNINSFLRRTNRTQKKLASELGCSFGLIGQYGSKKAVPSYEKCIELIKLGITLDELFGEDVSKIMRETILNESLKIVPDSDFEKQVITVLNKVFNSGNIRISFQ